MKTLILLEMTVLLGGGLLIRRHRGEAWSQILLADATRIGIAVLVLLTLLLSADEVGWGGAAAIFGGLVVLGYLLSAAGALGPAIQSVEKEFFG